MTQPDANRIISLTYHEITEDPRILKQARALVQGGYNVTVYSNWISDLPQYQEINGVQIVRFDAFSPTTLRPEALSELDFLKKSRDELERRFMSFATKYADLNRFESALDPEIMEQAAPSYYQNLRGIKRLRRKLTNRMAQSKLEGILSEFGIAEKEETASNFKRLAQHRRDLQRACKEQKRNLFQASSVVFWANFPRNENLDDVAAIHAHDIYCLPTGVALSRKLGVPLVYDAHEYEPARATQMAPDAVELPEWIEEDCFPFVARLITVSDGIGALYAQRFDGPEPVIVMNAPEVTLEALGPNGYVGHEVDTIREQTGMDDSVPLIVFTGGVQGTHRGLDKVMEALKHLPDAYLVVVGPRIPTHDEWLMNCAKSSNIEDRVVLLPSVDARDVPAAISTADVSVIPFQDVSLNHQMALPNKLFEAAFARIPICVSDLPEMRRFVETLKIGRTMDQTDPAAIAQAIQDVLDNRKKYSVTPEAERKLLEMYSWTAQTKKLLSLYNDLIGLPQAPTP